MIPIEDKALLALARRFSPVLRFHESERFFPLKVESWLTTTSEGVWPEHPDRAVHLRSGPDDSARRGAALLSADRAMTALQVLAGPPVGGTRPLDLGDDRDNPYSMVAGLLTKTGADAFLDVGGWVPGAIGAGGEFDAGDLERLAALCSEMASAINPGVRWTPAHDLTTRPWPWVAQPPHPTMYCEITWAGAYPRTSVSRRNREFPEGETGLDHVVVFTYHLFYAAREAPEAASGARHSEGQWEAISLFFPAEVEVPREGALLKAGSIAEEPSHVVISQGQDRGVDGHWSALEDYAACERVGEHPVVYVARGTHRHYFAPVDGETFDPNAHPPHGPDTTTHHNEDDSWIGVDGFLASAGVMLGVAVLLVAAAAIIAASVAVLAGLALIAVVALVVLAIIVVIAALILFIMWIVSACTESSDEDAGEDVSHGPEPDEAGGGGPQVGGDGSEEPAGSGGGPGGSSSGTSSGGGGPGGGGGGPGGGGAVGSVGLPNTGSPTGRESVFADVRIVERLLIGGASKAHTTHPTDRELENPPWWDYRGRWGVRVRNLPGSGTWESGWHRVDERDRDWGYFLAERYLVVQHGGPRQSA